MFKMHSDGCQLAGLVRKRFVGRWIGIAEPGVPGEEEGFKSSNRGSEAKAKSPWR